MEQELNQIEQRDLSPLKERIYGTIARRRKRRRAVRSVSAAAAVVLAIGIWQWNGGGHEVGLWAGLRSSESNSNVDAPIALAKSVDVELTLANGQTVALDGAQAAIENEELIHQGGTTSLIDGGTNDTSNPTGTTGSSTSATDASNQSKNQINSIFVPRGKRFELTLADGTRVWLNAGSSLRFPAAFGGGERRVELNGEACFDVAKNAQKPFIVQAAGQQVHVLGTLFNVNAYQGEQAVFTLRRGSIALESGTVRTVLQPGQQAVLLNNHYNVSQAADGATAWVEGEFAFGGQRLDAVMARLARWYDFEYEFSGSTAAAMRLSGEVPMFDDMETIIRLIESSGQVTVQRKGKKLVING